MKQIFALVLILVIVPCVCFSLDPNRKITQYKIEIWNEEDGLPTNAVQNLVQAADGYLWVGTEKGLARFDGIHFITFDNSQTGLAGNSITSLCTTPDRSLWISGATGLVRLKDGRFQRIRAPGSGANSFAKWAWAWADSKGGIWLRNDHGYIRYWNGNFQTYQTEASGNLCEDRKGVIWSTKTLSRLQDNNFSPVASLSNVKAVWCSVDIQNDLWLTSDAGVVRVHNGEGSIVPLEDKISIDTIM